MRGRPGRGAGWGPGRAPRRTARCDTRTTTTTGRRAGSTRPGRSAGSTTAGRSAGSTTTGKARGEHDGGQHLDPMSLGLHRHCHGHCLHERREGGNEPCSVHSALEKGEGGHVGHVTAAGTPNYSKLTEHEYSSRLVPERGSSGQTPGGRFASTIIVGGTEVSDWLWPPTSGRKPPVKRVSESVSSSPPETTTGAEGSQ